MRNMAETAVLEPTMTLIILLGLIAAGIYILASGGDSMAGTALIVAPLAWFAFAAMWNRRRSKLMYRQGWQADLAGITDDESGEFCVSLDVMDAAAFSLGRISAREGIDPDSEFDYKLIVQTARGMHSRGLG